MISKCWPNMRFKQMAADYAAIGSSENGMEMQRRFRFSDGNVAKKG